MCHGIEPVNVLMACAIHDQLVAAASVDGGQQSVNVVTVLLRSYCTAIRQLGLQTIDDVKDDDDEVDGLYV